MKTVAYLRVSTRSQDLANQKLAILEFSQKRRFPIDQFIESRISSRKSPLERRIDEMLGTLQPGDRLLVSELSRLGRSLGQVIQIVETLVRRKIRFIAIKEAIEFDGKQDLRTKVMIALFGLFAEVERDLISERTKEGLAAAKAKGKRLAVLAPFPPFPQFLLLDTYFLKILFLLECYGRQCLNARCFMRALLTACQSVRSKTISSPLLPEISVHRFPNHPSERDLLVLSNLFESAVHVRRETDRSAHPAGSVLVCSYSFRLLGLPLSCHRMSPFRCNRA